MHPTAAKVQERLGALGLDAEVRELDASTRTAAEAAAAVGSEVGQIVKSLVFYADGLPLLVLCAGDRRVAPEKLGPDARPARADEVREATGFAIGGVPPLGHDRPLRTVVDRSLLRWDEVWCAAGTPNAVFRASTTALVDALPDGRVADVAAD